MSQSTTPSVREIEELIDREALVERLRSLVSTRSENPPGEELAVARLAGNFCEDLGLDVTMRELEPDRPSVIARKPGGSGPTLGYCSHLDVVPAGPPELWERDPYGAVVEGGRMFGRGSSDAKGPVAAALEAVSVLNKLGVSLAGTLELEFVADEETMGFKGAGWLVKEGLINPDMAIVGEPTRLRVVRAQRGVAWFRVTAHGVAAHGSAPERGKSAIRHMAEIVDRLEETLPSDEHPLLGGCSINVGVIHGGEKVNVVPARCVVEIDRRTIPGETEESVTASIAEAVERARKRFPDIEATIELSFYGHPFEIDEGSRVVSQVVGAVTEARGQPAAIAGFRGASDARFLAEAGADVVVCGPGDIEVAHTAREFIDLEELERGAVAYALAFARLLAPS